MDTEPQDIVNQHALNLEDMLFGDVGNVSNIVYCRLYRSNYCIVVAIDLISVSPS